MTIATEAASILRSAPVRRIHFRFNTPTGQLIEVNASTFERVAAAIDTGRVQIADATGFPRQIAAAYGPHRNTLVLRHVRGRRGTGHLVHENVHASLDLSTGGRTITRADGECAAYVAEHVYLRHAGLSMPGAIPIHVQADLVAYGVVRNGAVSAEPLAHLRALICRHPVYAAHASSTPTSDG